MIADRARMETLLACVKSLIRMGRRLVPSRNLPDAGIPTYLGSAKRVPRSFAAEVHWFELSLMVRLENKARASRARRGNLVV